MKYIKADSVLPIVLVEDERDIIGTNQRKPSKIKGSQMI